MTNNVVHFAIHADDVERARRFYEAVFGWRFEAWGPPGFYNIDTGTADHPGIHGALHARSEPLSGTGVRGFSCTVAVDDLAETRDRVVANDGSVRACMVLVRDTRFRHARMNQTHSAILITKIF